MDNSKNEYELEKLNLFWQQLDLFWNELSKRNIRSMCSLLGVTNWRQIFLTCAIWEMILRIFAYNSHAYTKYHKPAASAGFLLRGKKADHCQGEGGEEWRAAAMYGLHS